MLKPLVILGLVLTFTGCATSSSQTANNSLQENKQAAEENNDKPEYICQKVHRVGTNFKQTKCWPKEEYTSKQETDKEAFRQLQRSTKAPPESR